MLACREAETLSPAAPTPSGQTFTLRGQVIASRTRAPISDATVSILNGLHAGRSTTTDASGNFSFTEVQESSVSVEVSAPEYFKAGAPLTNNQTLTVFLVAIGPVIQLFGRVTDLSTSAPIADATVYINGRYKATTDASGNYGLMGRLDNDDSNITFVYADAYESHTRYILGNPLHSFGLRRIERILAGQSWSVTVQPDDSLCFNNYQDPSFVLPGFGSLCRTVRVMAQSNGMLKVEAVSTMDGSRPPLAVEVLKGHCCDDAMQNPISVKVTTGSEVLVYVPIPERSTTGQSFFVKTSMSGSD